MDKNNNNVIVNSLHLYRNSLEQLSKDIKTSIDASTFHTQSQTSVVAIAVTCTSTGMKK